jgi:hypothetical protein
MHRVPGNLEQLRQLLQRMRHVHHPSGLRRDVARASYGDSDARRRQGRRVVDSVAHQGHHAALRRQLPHAIQLLLGQQFGLHMVDTDLACHGLRRTTPVARQHHLVADFHRTKPAHRSRSRIPPASCPFSDNATAVAPR